MKKSKRKKIIHLKKSMTVTQSKSMTKQGTVALWFNASALDRKIEGSNLAANFSFERTTMTREERGDEFGDENETK